MKFNFNAIFSCVIIVFLLTAAASCKKSSSAEDATGSLLSHSQDCKQFTVKGQESQSLAAGNTSCISFQYDGAGTLKLTHINAGFNCCTTDIYADIDFSGNLITITESEESAACDCHCLYDVNFEIVNLKPGQYTFRFIEPYRNASDDPLVFTIQLNGASTGEYCADRHHYPWGDF